MARDDAFDCVTFCGPVLAATGAGNLAEFEALLRPIRYRHGVAAPCAGGEHGPFHRSQSRALCDAIAATRDRRNNVNYF